MHNKSTNKMHQVKVGATLSYILIILNSIYSLIVTPFIISKIGEIDYGTYKTIASLSTSLAVLDIGLGGTLMRYIAKYRADSQKEKISSFISMATVEGGILIAIISIVCAIIYWLIPTIYKSGLTDGHIGLAKKMFFILSLNLCFHIIENILNGIISGFNQFAFGNGLKLLRVILRIVCTYVFLTIVKSALTLVLIDFFLTLILIACEVVFVLCKLKIRLSFRKPFWDSRVFIDSFKYTLLLFLTSIAAQVNSNLDNVVIGAEIGAVYVTIYSMGLVIFGMFENISTSISGVMLPTVTFALKNDEKGEIIQSLIIKIGRIQFLLLGAVAAGFTVLGKQFVYLWLGSNYEDVYIIVLLLMYPSILELCVNVCLSVLRAKNKLGFRTIILCSTTLLNALITIIGVKLFGYYAAAIGTGLSFIIGSVIIMNIYYHRSLGYNMIKIYIGIFKGILPCLLIATILTYVASMFIIGGWGAFLLNGCVFCLVYGILLVKYGLTKDERKAIPIIKHLKENKND